MLNNSFTTSSSVKSPTSSDVRYYFQHQNPSAHSLPHQGSSSKFRRALLQAQKGQSFKQDNAKKQPHNSSLSGSFSVTLYCGKGKHGYKDGLFSDVVFNGTQNLCLHPNGYVRVMANAKPLTLLLFCCNVLLQ